MRAIPPAPPRPAATRRSVAAAHLLASGIASQRIEGLHLAADQAEELRQVAEGTLSPAELRARLLGRHRRPAAPR